MRCSLVYPTPRLKASSLCRTPLLDSSLETENSTTLLLFSPSSTGFQLKPGQILWRYYFIHKILHGLAPSYLKDLIISYCPSRPLWSSGAGLLSIPKVKKKSGRNTAISYRAPDLWNNLPPVIRKLTLLINWNSILKPTSLLTHWLLGVPLSAHYS